MSPIATATQVEALSDEALDGEIRRTLRVLADEVVVAEELYLNALYAERTARGLPLLRLDSNLGGIR